MTTALSTPANSTWYLVGLPGTGKSHVGRILADFFKVEHFDIDSQIEQNTRKTIAQIFAEDGESAFRALEAEQTLSSGEKPGVVSLGGGAIETPQIQDFLQGKTVIWIDADDGELLRRIKGSMKRPLMAKNPETILRDLRKRRQHLYQKFSTIRVFSTAGPPSRVAKRILGKLLDWDYAEVTGTLKYRVITGNGTTSLLSGHLPKGATKAFVVLPESMVSRAAPVLQRLEDAGLEVTLFRHIDGESAKDLETAKAGWSALADAKIGRKDVVVTFGGGVTTDLGGFLAATWLRGVPVVHLPTSLLGMVDAAIGGKTGINTPAGKNLVGAFYDPQVVIADTAYLSSLPPAEYIAGLAEVIKAGFIWDTQILKSFEQHRKLGDITWATGPGSGVLFDVIRRSVAVKARVVSTDRLEGGLREILNYGHTFGHAIERAENYSLRHGEAVAIGAVFAATLAHSLGHISEQTLEKHRKIFAGVGLPTDYVGDLGVLLEGMTSDKKVRSGALRFVLLQQVGKARVVEVSTEDVKRAAKKMELTALARNIL